MTDLFDDLSPTDKAWNTTRNLSFTGDLIREGHDLIEGEGNFRGVRVSHKRKPLPNEVAIERNILKVPICVAHAKSSKAEAFTYEFPERLIDGERCIPKLIIKSAGGTPLPLPQHAKTLDVLLALFAQNFNLSGELWFTFKEITRILNTTEVTTVKESIKRYHFNPIFFQHCWVEDPGRFTSEVFHIIDKTDLFDEEHKNKNPRNSRKKENLHYVKFSPVIVRSVEKRFIRLFPRDAFSALSAGTYTLYKIFYGPTDKEPVRRTLHFIANFLAWSDRIDRLYPWIVKHLEILREKDFVLWWQVKGDCFEVCSNPAVAKRQHDDLKRVSPLSAETIKRTRVFESKKKAKLLGTKVDEETKSAISTRKPIAKKVDTAHEKTKKLTRAQKFLAELAALSPAERANLAPLLQEIVKGG